MNVIVIGCGRVGAELAYRLYKRGHQVTVVDEIASAFENLPPDFRGRTLEGEVLSLDVLRRAGIEQAQGLACVTPSDPANAVVAHVAREIYHIPNVVVRNYDPHHRPLLEAFGLQVVAPSSWGAQRIEELVSGLSVHTVLSAGNGEVEVYEFSVPPAWEGRKLGELLIPGQSVCVALTRAGQAMLPSPDTLLQDCDVVHLSATMEGVAAVRKQLRAAQEA
ncbi:MAG TPA: TrkA family potassium uptake protein [Anaerolineae bacterium]